MFAFLDAWIFEERAAREFAAALEKGQASPASRPKTPLVAGALIGGLRIARLGLSVAVVEGVDKKSLRRAAGHISGSALPGEAGNVAISAHRDTFFRPLRNIQLADTITITTLDAEFHYRVVSTRVVIPTDVSVLAPSSNEILTLVTCYPFYFVGAAPQRFIVRAERVI